MSDFFTSGFEEAEKTLTPFFHQITKKYGWPEDVPKKIKIKVDSTGVHTEYDVDIEKEIHDLEYGNLSKRPQAAMRDFSYQANRIVDQILTTKGAEALIDKGLFG